MLPLACEEPFAPLAAWIRDARGSPSTDRDRYFAEGFLPDAVQVATVGPDGRPSLRTVLLQDHGPAGLVFFTNTGSRKGRELRANPRVALQLHWPALQRQVIVEGLAAPVGDDESEAYWAHRPRASQIAGWASRQSEPLASREALEREVAETEARFAGVPVPRPPSWGGFRCRADRVEFWQGRVDRLHERCVFALTDQGSWARTLLYP